MTSRDREEHATVMSGLAVLITRLDRQQQELRGQLDAAHDRRVAHDDRLVESLLNQIFAVKNHIQTIEKEKQHEDVAFAKKLLHAEMQTPSSTSAQRLHASAFPRPPSIDERIMQTPASTAVQYVPAVHVPRAPPMNERRMQIPALTNVQRMPGFPLSRAPPMDEGRVVEEKVVIDLCTDDDDDDDDDDDEPTHITEVRALQSAGVEAPKSVTVKRERSPSSDAEELAVLRDHFPLQHAPGAYLAPPFGAAEQVLYAAEPAQHAPATRTARLTQQPTPTPSAHRVGDGRCGKRADTDNAIIAESHPTVVPAPNGNGGVKLRYYLCGGNSGARSRMFRGVRGFLGHLLSSHRGHLAANEYYDVESISRRCAVNHISQELVERIQAGDAGAYVVPVYPGVGKDSAPPRGRTLDRWSRRTPLRPAPYTANPYQRSDGVIEETRQGVPGLSPAVWAGVGVVDDFGGVGQSGRDSGNKGT